MRRPKSTSPPRHLFLLPRSRLAHLHLLRRNLEVGWSEGAFTSSTRLWPLQNNRLSTTSRLAFRALRVAGLLAGLGLTAFAAYQEGQQRGRGADMSSFGSRRRPLDATSGREVVYCYGCSHEWYRDEREGLQCPRCGIEATEIVRNLDSHRRASIILTVSRLTPRTISEMRFSLRLRPGHLVLGSVAETTQTPIPKKTTSRII